MAVPADIGKEERNQEMKKQWYQAEIRWAVMEQGQGLREWKDSVYFFMNENPEAALQHALEIGYRECEVHEEDGTLVETRLAQVVSLACLGTNPTELAVRLGSIRATESVAFEHVFDPEAVAPMDVL